MRAGDFGGGFEHVSRVTTKNARKGAETQTKAAKSLLRATGRSYLEIDQDGQPKRGVSGRNVDRGTRVRLAADESLRIRVGNAGAVQLVVNGLDLGRMGESGAVVEWRITRR